MRDRYRDKGGEREREEKRERERERERGGQGRESGTMGKKEMKKERMKY